MISPRLNTEITYRANFHRKFDFNNPATLNEKICWLKLNDYSSDPVVKQCADKYRVREYVEAAAGGGILNPLIAAYRSVDEIKWEDMPNQFALKLNIGMGFNHIVPDLKKENIDLLKKEIRMWLRKAPRFYLQYAEMQYKDVEPVILAEKYLGGPNGELPEDYKFFCIHGRVELIMLCVGRDYHGHCEKYYFLDREWNLKSGYGETSLELEKPEALQDAIRYAELLSKEFPLVRVDFYLLDGKAIFGEMTFTPCAGLNKDYNRIVEGTHETIDEVYGRLLDLKR